MRRNTLASGIAPVLFALSIHAAAHAAAQDVQLTFSSLPSAQGFAYTPTGSHAGALEASVFSVAGNTLTVNSMGQGIGAGGGIMYIMSGIATTTETKQLHVTARCLTFEGSGAQNFAFGFTTGTTQYDISLTPTGIHTLGPGGNVVVAGTYDNTTFHDYILDFTPPNSFRIYRDNVLIHTGTNGVALGASQVWLGDGTGGGNAHSEITAYRFLQGTATWTPGTTWGRLKSLYR